MSEALISEPGLSLWERTRLFPRHVNRAASATAPKTLPEVRPGQLWYVELPSTERAVSPLEYRALTTANVVVYDRVLEPAVTQLSAARGLCRTGAAPRRSDRALPQFRA